MAKIIAICGKICSGKSYYAKQIRNKRVLSGEGGSDYYLDEGLMAKLESMWEEPAPEEMDVWYRLVRK